MSDEERLNLEDVGAGADEAEVEERKAAFIPAVIIKFLKWAAIGLGFIILGATTTVITFRLLSKGRMSTELTIVSPQYQAKAEPLEYDNTIESIRGVTADEAPAIFSMRVGLGYEAGNNKIAFELNARRWEIQNIILLFISTKTKDDLRPERYAQLQEELKQQINRVMKEGKIKKVVFREFVVTQ